MAAFAGIAAVESRSQMAIQPPYFGWAEMGNAHITLAFQGVSKAKSGGLKNRTGYLTPSILGAQGWAMARQLVPCGGDLVANSKYSKQKGLPNPYRLAGLGKCNGETILAFPLLNVGF